MDNVNNENVIHVTVSGKIATADKNVYVCGNSGYEVHFDFDSEWSEHKTKTARFVCDDATYYDVLFDDAVCPVPILSNTRRVRVGVFAGDLITTTPAYITAAKSILCDGGVPADPPDDVYSQLMEKLNRMAEENLARIEEALAENTQALGGKIAALGNETTAQFEAVAKSLSDQASAIKEIHEQGVALAEQDDAIIARTEALEKRFKAMDYGDGITLSFAQKAGTKEKGSVITAVPLEWSYGKAEYLVSQELNGVVLPLGQRSMTATTWPNEPDRALAITMDSNTWPTWTIKATDSEDKVVTKSVHNFTFQNRVYYGTAADPRVSGGEINSAFVKSLQNRPLSSGKVSSINVNAGAGEYVWYCVPKWMGKRTFSYNNNEVTFDEYEVAVTLADNVTTETYYVYRNANPGLGNMTLGVN